MRSLLFLTSYVLIVGVTSSLEATWDSSFACISSVVCLFLTGARFLSSFSPSARISVSILSRAFSPCYVFAPFSFAPLRLFHPSFLFPRALVTFARFFRRPHLFLARDSLVSILGRTQASFINHLPSTHSNSYNFFSL